MRSGVERPVVFSCEGEPLIGILHTPTSTGASVGVLIIVGGPQYRVGSHRQFVQLARGLAASGYPTFRFDYRGMGDSAAQFGGFEHVTADIRAAVDVFLSEVPGLDGVVLFGLCDAASAALMYVGCDTRIRGIVLANPWVRTTGGEAKSLVRHYYGQRFLQRSFWRKLAMGELNVVAALQDFFSKFGRSVRAPRHEPGSSVAFIDRMLQGFTSFAGPVLVLVSERDLTAQEYSDLCRSSLQWKAASSRPNVLTIDCAGADHTFSTRIVHERMISDVARWLVTDVGSDLCPRQRFRGQQA